MTLALYDRVQETTATSGTGSITLGGAASGYQSFAVVGNGNTCYYTIVNNSAWEVGIGTYSTTGPTLARTTVLSNSNGNTSPITLSGSSSVFVTYPAEKSVNLDASGNVSALGTISSGVWQATTIATAYGGTGVTTSSGANSNVLRDANVNITANNVFTGFTSTVTAAGTTTLTAASTAYQRFTGTTTQTVKLPDATTLTNGFIFTVDNDSTGALTVVDNASTTLDTIPSGGIDQWILLNNGTSAGSWTAYSQIPSSVDWGTNSLALGATVISGGTWQGGVVQPTYGGTGLSTFVAANNALYSSGASTLTAGTLPVAAGGTGITSLTANYIPVGNGTSGFTSSSSLQFASGVLVVGGSSVLGGATNPITAFTGSANNYIQTYVYNQSTGISGSADFVAYANNSTDAHGWADMGFTSSTYADPVYTVTGPNEAYILGSAPSGAGATGNLVYATDSTGSANAHQWYVGGFTQLKSAWKMQLTSTGLQLANALGVSYGGTGVTTSTGSGSVVLSTSPTLVTPILGTPQSGNFSTGTFTWPTFNQNTTGTAAGLSATLAIGSGGTGTTTAQGAMNTFAQAVTSGQYLRGNGTNVVMSVIQAADVPTLNQNTTGTAAGLSGSQTANFFYAAPNGSAGTASFRAIVAADIPTLNQNTTGSAASATTATTASTANALNTANNYQVNSLGVGTAGSGTAGEIRATNNVTAYYSDNRLKTKIGDIENPLAQVRRIKTLIYHANEVAVALGYDASVIEVGLDAQSVQAVQPYVVAPAPIDAKYLTVRYERLVPLLIEAIKALDNKVDLLGKALEQ